MWEVLIYTFLLSLSPIGEARAGIPFAILNHVHVTWAFSIGLLGNLMVYPLLMWLIDTFNRRLWPNRIYRRNIVRLSRRAKKGIGASIQKYGFWALMIFVMIPLPGTGAYMATIAASVLKIERAKAFLSISLGTLISCALMALGTYLGSLGIDLWLH